ncbi:18247_t:CDS:2, partial [Funneliformis geosporum]
DVIKKLAYEIFYEHKQLSEQQIKERFKEKLDSDEHYVDFLQKSNERGLTFDELWNRKMYSSISTKELKKICDRHLPIDPEDVQADTYISLIIKSIFTVEKELIQLNGFGFMITDTEMDSDVYDHYSAVYLPSNQL